MNKLDTHVCTIKNPKKLNVHIRPVIFAEYAALLSIESLTI